MKVNGIYRVVHFLTRAFFRLYGQWEIVDYHKLPAEGPVIAAPNHVSYLDPEMVGAAITRECAFMARHDLWENRFLAWLLPKLGSFPVNREKPDRASIRSALEALERGLCLVIFPEGARSVDGRLRAAEPGIALLVQKSGAPVVPVALIGSERMLPVGASRLTRTRLKVVFGDPLTFSRQAPREEVLLGVMGGIAALLAAHGHSGAIREGRPPACSFP